MTESKKLILLRGQCIFWRRAIFDRFQGASTEPLNGEDITRIQDAIDAVDGAIADEILAESNEGNRFEQGVVTSYLSANYPLCPVHCFESQSIGA